MQKKYKYKHIDVESVVDYNIGVAIVFIIHNETIRDYMVLTQKKPFSNDFVELLVTFELWSSLHIIFYIFEYFFVQFAIKLVKT